MSPIWCRLPVNHYAHVAMQESKSLLRNGFPCWIADLNWVLSHLPGWLALGTHIGNMDISQLLSLQKAVVRRCDGHLCDVLLNSTKCSPAHRRLGALASIMFASHVLAIERLRWGERYRTPVAREWRLCCFCRARVEDKVHTLIECRGDSLHSLHPVRDAMRLDVMAITPDFSWRSDARTVLLHLLHDVRLSVPVARFIYKFWTSSIQCLCMSRHPTYIPLSCLHTHNGTVFDLS